MLPHHRAQPLQTCHKGGGHRIRHVPISHMGMVIPEPATPIILMPAHPLHNVSLTLIKLLLLRQWGGRGSRG